MRAHSVPDRAKTSCDQKLLLELIDAPINLNLLAIRSSYQSSLTSWSSNEQVIGCSYQSSLAPQSIKNFLRSKALIRAHWLPNQPINVLWLGALIRAYWFPDWSKPFCDQKLLLELIDSLIGQQTCCNRELLSELIVNPINNYWISDWSTNFLKSNNELFEIVNSHQSSVTQEMINNLLAIGSSNWSSLTPALLNKPLAFCSSYQSSLTP